MLIKIVPLGNIPEDILTRVAYAIMNIFNSEIQATKPLDIPKEAFDTFRKQYSAPLILSHLSKRFDEHVLAITTEDLYDDKLNFVFGEAQFNGNVSIISTYRLDPKFYKQPENNKLFLDRVLKESVHEIGHMLGLEHCLNSTCVMSFSNSISDVDNKRKELCSRCRIKIKI